jgi:hypothetical protein
MSFYQKKKREKGAGKAVCATAWKLLTIIFSAAQEGTRLLVPGGQTLQPEATRAQCRGLSVDFA